VHQGIDIAVPMGTPLLAIADGEVVTGGMGPSIGGIGLVVRHPPRAIEQSFYVYSFYKHLQEISPLPVGTQVRKGQRVGSAGNTGTEGGHYGGEGFAHLHFEIHTRASESWPSGMLTDPVPVLRRLRAWPLACR
jgi:murein DD-endopeptidase MepM/ murein hydrolase activator NlpD